MVKVVMLEKMEKYVLKFNINNYANLLIFILKIVKIIYKLLLMVKQNKFNNKKKYINLMENVNKIA